MPEGLLSLIVTMLPAFREIERRLDREAGRKFNAFNLFDMDEPATSRILAFLLDPTEAHGQNDVFLRAFIRQFIPQWRQTFNYSEWHVSFVPVHADVDGWRGRHSFKFAVIFSV